MALPTFTAGRRVRASELKTIVDTLNVASAENIDTTSRTTGAVTFTGTLTPAGLCGVAFVAPPSGVVACHWNCELGNSGTNATGCAPAFRTGATVGGGSAVAGGAAGFDTAIRNSATGLIRAAGFFRMAGLTPGTTYNVSLEQAVTAGTGTFARREVHITPLLG